MRIPCASKIACAFRASCTVIPAATTVVLTVPLAAAVKLAAIGHGTADKDAVGRGVTLRLGLPRRPSADAADALALALCHLQDAPLRTALARAGTLR